MRYSTNMTRYIAMLRGINVGGHNKIAMPALAAGCASLGFSNVSTYVQSGNVIFSAEDSRNSDLAGQISEMIMREFGLTISVIVRSHTEMQQVVENNPFLADEPDYKKLHVTFLEAAPDPILVAAFNPPLGPNERWHLAGSQVYLHFPDGYGVTKLSNNLFEHKLKQVATTRNWKTVATLAELSK